MKYTVDYDSLEQFTVEADNPTLALQAAKRAPAHAFVTQQNEWTVYETDSGRCVDGDVDHDAADADETPAADEPVDPLCRCANCGWTGTADEIGRTLDETPDLGERLEPGREVPVGECPQPECGAFVYFVKPVAPTYSLAELRNGTGFAPGVRFVAVKA